MTEEQIRVAELIRTVFRNVRLGDGIGLSEANGLDDRADEKTLAGYRLNDEKLNWSKIPPSDLDSYNCGLSFFDAEGMRFHLPAYLIADLEGTVDHVIVFHLTYFEHDATSRFSLLSDSQRAAVREYLLLRLSDADYEFDHPLIETALDKYWTPTERTA